jgi:hypothetical protein
MARWGAERSDWDHLTLVMGLDTELLPVVSNPQATIAPASKLKDIGKVPSVYDRARQVVGLAGWPSRRAVERELLAWRGEPDYGICLQCRTIRAIDVDVTDAALAEEVQQAIEEYLGLALPRRFRANSSKFLLAFRLGGSFTKRVLRTAHGNIEFLADGQQFIACGTHSSGVRYEWASGLPDDFPALTTPQFEALWEYLVERFGVPGGAVVARQGVARASKLVEAATGDPVAKYLVDNGWFLSNNRDGSFNIRCPNEAQHTTASNETATTYWPAHTGGFARGHFKCLHAHCADKSDHDFLQAIGFYATEFDMIEGRGPGDAPVEVEADIVFERNSKTGAVIANLHNLSLALASQAVAGVAISYDTFRDELQIAWEGEGPRPYTDADGVKIRRRLERKIGFQTVSRELFRDALLAHKADNIIDSAQLWLGRQHWDGRPRVAAFATRYLGVAPGPYAEAVSRYIWTALAARVLEPGAKADMVPVLIGPQGGGKTSAVKAIAPTPEQFVELRLDAHDDNLSRAMRGKLVGELGELRGLAGRDAEANKAWLSRTHEEWTPKYVEYTTKFPRRLVLFGTTNEDQFLQDDTGERRWLPLTVGRIDVDAIEHDREQLWAEGAFLWEAGGVAFADAERLAPDHHGAHKVIDPWDAIIAAWVEESDFGDDLTGERRRDKPLTASRVLTDCLGLKAGQLAKRDQMRVGRILSRLGFARISTHVNGKKGWFWVNVQ